MFKTSIYYDSRRKTAKGEAPVRIRVAKGQDRTFITTTVKMTEGEWSEANSPRCRNPRLLMLMRSIERMRIEVEEVAYGLELTGTPTVADVRNAYEERVNPEKKEQRIAKETEKGLVRYWFAKRMELKKGKTLSSIGQTQKKILDFDADAKLDDITPAWLQRFDAFMAKTAPSPNARAVHMRNLRAVINFAIDEGATDTYAFRRFHIKTVKTAKRSIPVEGLRAFFGITGLDDADRKYLDMFKLIFLLIGINSVDLLHLKHSDMRCGRIEYNRSKTKRLYSIKVEPEALEIINRYRGEMWLVDPLDKVGNWENYLRRLNKALSALGNTRVGKHGKKERDAMFPGITTYWARHSWATIAASLDIPKETIAAALGHGGSSVTDIYIDFDRKKIDDANRRVIDWVLYGKK